jgi:serine/threonine protein kinase
MNQNTILHYSLLEKIGEGGMGVVYKAQDQKLERFVALKFLPPRVADNNEKRARFVIEARVTAALNHPNIATIYTIEETEDEVFIVMEFIEGTELSQIIAEGDMEETAIISIATQIAQGLMAAHDKMIIHRDIKSSNIMIKEDGLAKILDFGLAKLIGRTDLTKTGATLGTLGYMSPEQVRGEEIDKRSDLWSMGVVLYEMVAGHRPFMEDNYAAMLQAILLKDYVPLTTTNPNISRRLTEVVDKCLKKELTARYQNAQEILEGLSRLSDSYSKTLVAPIEKKKSIVVLPFDDLSPGSDNEYFSDGLTEEIIADLSKVHDLRVISRTSAMMLKGTDKDSRTIGRELNVQFLLEGSVRKAGNSLRITAQLIDALDDAHLWAEKYSGTLENIFEIQESVSQKIVEALKIELTPQESRLVAKKSVSPAAHQAYLQGRYYLNQATPEGFFKAIPYFGEAIEIEKSYALAYAGLATSYNYLGWSGGLPGDVFPKAKQAALTALKIDEMLPEAHLELGYTAMFHDMDWTTAEKHMERAIALNPSSSQAHLYYSWFLSSHLRFDESIASMKRASEMDPLSLVIQMNLPNIYHSKGDYVTMLELSQKTLEIAPHAITALLNAAWAHCEMEQYDEASRYFEKVVDIAGLSSKGLLGYAYGMAGHDKEAKTILEELMEPPVGEHVRPLQIAFVFIGLKQFDEAFVWLNNSFEQRSSPLLVLIQTTPMFNLTRSDPRYDDLLRRMNFKR